ncbi:hypothetical protein Poli38472_006105 [Pythium oligandrum]|uniref:Uncharacterized protein n=1 Tax=Pythium oligandrum TaxID=41045 RepID=A0A8K1CTR6_PYTOL|nr:hypothetical protein Poli38472_006105 [Pythium oligandrum]|eukprot:TMW68637.1 hypothetical protein Poli38472_006105 [Pythium oligandrum]
MVISTKTLFVSVALVAAASIQEIDAHTYVKNPLSEFKKGTQYPSEWVKEFGPPWEGTFKTGAQYVTEAEKRGFKDLRSFLDDKGPDCGNTLQDATPKAIPSNGMVEFASTMEHPGPCEIWFDNTRAFYNEDCEKAYGTVTSIKVDFSACKGNCLMRFYWLGLQDSGKRWQSYKNCIPLKGGSGSGSTTPTPTNATPKPGNTPKATTATPSTTPNATSKPTSTPKATTATPSTTPKATMATPKPSSTTAKPTTAPSAAPSPSPSKAKCLRRARN